MTRLEWTEPVLSSASMLAAAAPNWQVRLTGWPWWLVLVLAGAGIAALVRLHRLEMASLNPRLRLRLLLLRASALGLLILFLMEPSLSRRVAEKVLPLVAVLVDQSASMTVKDDPAGRTRYERAVKLAQDQLTTALQNEARMRVFAMDTALVPLDLSKPPALLPNRATDFESCLTALARNWSQEYLGGILLLSDGRQTAGADPVPVVRGLRARGAVTGAILVGAPGTPQDAVLAEISGSSEVFLGEPTVLSVRHRITGAENLDWDLVLSREGVDLERRIVRGNSQWQYESFSLPSTNAGANLYQARLEVAGEQISTLLIRPSGTVTLELWNNIAGQAVSDLTSHANFKQPPSATATFNRLEYNNRGTQYGARIRGLLIPPQSGNYTFQLASDDSSELWLSASESPNARTRIASVAGYVPKGKWDNPGQRSQPVTLTARHPYYFEVLHKQGTGEDHLTVGWQLPDSTLERPIPGSRLSEYNEKTLELIAENRAQAAAARTNPWHEASLANNSAEFSVMVNEDPIKVLLLDSTPRWESRYLAAMFERDRRVTFTRRYHSVIIQDPNLPLLPRTQAEWDACDMVCMGDLDGGELPPDQQLFLANFVARRGGFLVCLAGPRGMPRAFSLGTMANLLPVRTSLQGAQHSEPVTVALTSQGTDHPIMQVLNDPGNNQTLWPLLPPLQWIADSVIAKPGATVLLAAQNPARTPIVAIQRYGAGRVLWMGTEESWRWRDRLGDRVHQTFWLQVMRWGLAGRLRGKDPRLQVGLDRYLLGPGEAAELKVRATLPSGETPAQSPMVKLEKMGEHGQVIAAATRNLEMSPLTEAALAWQLSLEGLDEGWWRVTTTHPASELQGLSEVRELVVRSQNTVEGIDLGTDLASLNRMAKAGGSQAVPLADAEAYVKDFCSKLKPRLQERRETIRLWNSYLSMLLVFGLLCAEWILRKREGLP